MMNLSQMTMLVTASLLTACTVGRDYQLPFFATPDNFIEAAKPEFSNKTIELKWWEVFKDGQLSALVNQTILNNHDLKVAHANLREARALYMEAGLNLVPTVTTHSNYTEQLRSTGSMNNRAFVPRELSLYSAGFDATWELDLFGRVRRNVEASNDEVEMQEASLKEVKISLIAEVARNYFELRGLQNQLSVIKQNIENQQQTLEITRVRVENGRGTELDTARIAAQLDNTRAIIPTLETMIAHAIHRVSVLTGQLPNALTENLSKVIAIPTLPETIAVGNPADLLRRRPDIQVVERRLAASTARIGVATADLFPKVTFVGTLSLEASTLSSMGAAGSGAYSLGPRISWAAFDLGRVYARIKAADAHADADLEKYQQTVLNALEETENALVSYNKTKEKQDFLASAVKSSLKAYDLAQLRFNEGMTDFLTVLDSQSRLLQDQNQFAQSQTETATKLVAVYKSLGG
ncbi:MAG: efflux transporter outer membrane subunit [Methylococcaceae bacterium]